MKEVRFTEEELVSFGNYLLSEMRELSFKQTSEEVPNAPSYDERKRFVNDADLQNWYILNRNNKQNKQEK